MTRRRVLVTAVALTATSVAASAQDLVFTDEAPGVFIDISATGTALGLSDDGVAEVEPGFDLTATLFAGDGSGRVWVSNNGAVGFLGDGGSAGAFFLNTELPSIGLFGGAHGEPQALAVHWDDLDSDTGDVYYETIGEPGSRVFIVQWQDRPHSPGDPVIDGNEVTFQVQILENGGSSHARLVYLDVDFEDPAFDEGASATIGYQDGGIGNTVQWSFNESGAVHAETTLTLMDDVVGCPADIDGSGAVDFGDILAILSAWGNAGGPEDLDGSGIVDFGDILVVLGAWGPCPQVLPVGG